MTSVVRRGLRAPGPAGPVGSLTADGRAWPASTPKDRRSAPVRSVVCSHIAVRLRQPASTPVTARDSTVGRPQAHAPTVPGISHVPENLDQGLARQGGRGGG